jgi:hypothetical protein
VLSRQIDFHDLSLAAERRDATKDGGKIVQKYGEIYGKVALRQTEEDRAEEERIVNMRDKRILNRLKKDWGKVMTQLQKTVPLCEDK